jgi:hypothetical protein
MKPTTTPAPLVIAHHAVRASTLRAVLMDWQADPLLDEARRRAVGRALDALTAAEDAGRTLLLETRDGEGMLVAGNGGQYLVSRAGLALACECLHGRNGGRGRCYHVLLVEAFAEGAERQAGERDADALAAELFGVADDDVLMSLFDAPEPMGGDWLTAEIEGYAWVLAGRPQPQRTAGRAA